MKRPIPNQRGSRWRLSLAAKTSTFLSALLLGAVLTASAQTPDLLFSAQSSSFVPGTPWPTTFPVGGQLNLMSSPGAMTVNGQNWEWNKRSTSDGFQFPGPGPGGSWDAPIAINGASIVVAVRPVRNGIGDGWNSVVDIMYSRLVLGVRNDNGTIQINRQGEWQNGPAIPNGQITVLSVVVQPNGNYKVWANGTQVMDITSTADMTSLDPTTHTWAGDPPTPALGFWSYINVGRNQPDGWPVFNGNIGDIYVYKGALSDTDRTALESSMITKYGTAAMYTITASATGGGSISPSGAVAVPQGADQTFTITTPYGYVLNDVVVDSSSQGAINTYTFPNVSADHTISASFTEQASISGTVTGPSGPVYSAAVSLSLNADGSSPINTRFTDATGNYKITPPNASGTYYLVARKGGLVTSAPLMVVMAGSSVTGQNFSLLSSGSLDPLVVLDASTLTSGALASWPNTGSLGGSFDSIDATHTPTVAANYGLKAVEFTQDGSDAGRQTLASAIPAPPQITGKSDWTISTKLARLNSAQNSDNFYAQWSGGDLGCLNTAAFTYRSDGYALTHWCWDIWFSGGAPSEVVFHTVTITYDGNAEKIFVDGVLNRTDYPGALSIADGGLMLVGGRTWHNVRGEDQYWRFNGAIAKLEIYDQALTDAQVRAKDLPPATVTLALTGGNEPSVVGELVTFTATVSGVGLPSGNVGFYDGTAPLGVVALDGAGQASLSTSGLGSGLHSITAAYAGDGFNGAATSSPLSHTVSGTDTRVTSTTTLASSANPSTAGHLVTFTATVTSSGTPTGTVNFEEGTTLLATVALDGAGHAAFTTPNLAVGAHTITAAYSGDVANKPSASAILNQTVNARVIPSTSDLWFSGVTESLPNSGPTGDWPSYLPSGLTFAQQNNPTVDIISGQKWELNQIANENFYRVFGPDSTSTPVSGATIVVAVKPIRTGTPNNWQSIVDIYRDNLVLAMRNGDGAITVIRNNNWTSSPAETIPDGQATILSLVVQPDGTYVVYANGVQVLANTTVSPFTAFVPNQNGSEDWRSYVDVGRNNGDGWAAFNGDIGDFFVYKKALSDAERGALEGDLGAKFGITVTPPPVYATLSGTVVDAATDLPIYNAVVQVGAPGANGAAMVTGTDGAYTLTGACAEGGIEVYADAVGYAGRRLLVTGSGGMTKKIALTVQDEPNSYNGNMEDLSPAFKPDQWPAVPWSGAETSIDWSASTTAKHGSKSLFYCYNETVTGDNEYAGVYKVLNVVPGYTYNFYFSSKADPEVARWQPLFEFHNEAGTGIGNYVSNEPDPHHEYAHVPYYDWHTYFNWTDRGSNVGAPVRRTPPDGTATAWFIFLYESDPNNTGVLVWTDAGTGVQYKLPIAGKGCYVDDLVLDAVPDGMERVTVPPDSTSPPVPTITSITGPVGGMFTISGTADKDGTVAILKSVNVAAPIGSWTELESKTVSAGGFSFQVPQGTDNQAFFRLQGK